MKTTNFTFPAGVIHKPQNLDANATNCWEAAMYRGIDLSLELKTLLLSWRNELHVFNLLGNREVPNLNPEYRWVPVEYLKKLGIQKGTVNPFILKEKLPNIKYMAFCSCIFEKEIVYTNDGSLNGTIIIPTSLIKTEFPEATIFDFSEPISN